MKYPKVSKHQTSGENIDPETSIDSIERKEKDTGRWRDLTAFWILALCNTVGYVAKIY